MKLKNADQSILEFFCNLLLTFIWYIRSYKHSTCFNSPPRCWNQSKHGNMKMFLLKERKKDWPKWVRTHVIRVTLGLQALRDKNLIGLCWEVSVNSFKSGSRTVKVIITVQIDSSSVSVDIAHLALQLWMCGRGDVGNDKDSHLRSGA